MAEIHNLAVVCRVCGGRLRSAKKRSTTYNCTEHHQLLQATFSIDVSSDSKEIHPQKFCNSCYAATCRHQTAASKGVPYRHSIRVFTWEKHQEEGCTVSSNQTLYAESFTKLDFVRSANILRQSPEEEGKTGRVASVGADPPLPVILQQ